MAYIEKKKKNEKEQWLMKKRKGQNDICLIASASEAPIVKWLP